MPALTQFWGSSADFMLFLYVGGGDGDAIGISDPDISITYLLLSKLKCKNINSLNWKTYVCFLQCDILQYL